MNPAVGPRVPLDIGRLLDQRGVFRDRSACTSRPQGPAVLTQLGISITFTRLYLYHFTLWFRSTHGQAHISSQQQAAHPKARLSCSHGGPLGTRSLEPPP